MEISSDKGKILINGINVRPSTNMWMNGKTLKEVDQFNYLGCPQTKDENIDKRSKDQSGASTLSHDKASNTMGNNAISFPANIKLYKSVVLSILLFGSES